MCGIVGYIKLQSSKDLVLHLHEAVQTLAKRGPDLQLVQVLSPKVGFAHARLSIIDTSDHAAQPMSDGSGRFTIVFNGEIFNFKELQQTYLADETDFHSSSDTEVLLRLYIRYGEKMLNWLNGFFAFAIYDSQEESVFIARDRMGIKPLLIYRNEELLLFGSEMKALLSFPINKELDYETLALYLQLNYIPGGNSMFKNTRKLMPGYCLKVDKDGGTVEKAFYEIPYHPEKIEKATEQGYESAKQTLRKLLDEAVQRRLIADVPLGAFLSGGIDSSVIVALASKYVSQLNTFSIGYKDEPFFDETKYADLVAQKYKTNHTVFSITNDEMFAHLFDILDYIDEPFADSSAIAVYILSLRTRKQVTVSLSGDGADELFSGYNKHKAEQRARANSTVNTILKNSLPLLNLFPKSRNSKLTNIFRQAHRYSEGLNLSKRDRYWRWCTFTDAQEAFALLKNKGVSQTHLEQKKEFVLQYIKEGGDLNDILRADMAMVLPNDMLTKVDLMSMANSLEVRVPFLDYTVVDFAFSLPVDYKLHEGQTKRIVKDTFRADLPEELYTRPKHGFEVPLLKWFRTDLKDLILHDLLSESFIETQNIFDPAEINKLKQQLFSNNPGEVHARIWGLIVFQHWWRKYFNA